MSEKSNTEKTERGTRTLNSPVLWAFVENIIGVIGMTCIVIFAEGGWKWMALLCLLNMNQIKSKKS